MKIGLLYNFYKVEEINIALNIQEKILQKLRMKSKIFNYRPLVLVFLAIIGGVLFCSFLQKSFALVLSIFLISLAILIYYSIIHKTFKYIIICVIFFVISFTSCVICNSKLNSPIKDYTSQTVEATVEKFKIYDNSVTITVNNVKVGEEKLKYMIVVSYNNTKELGYKKIEIGQRIRFVAEKWKQIKRYDDRGVNCFLGNHYIKASASTDCVEILDYSPAVRYKILNRLKNNLHKFLSNQNAELVFSAIIGDKTELGGDIYSSYRGAGVAHLLAVSGLHIGLVVAIITWLLKKLKANSIFSIIVIGILLLAYCYLCGFTHSVVRASVMSLILSGAFLMFSEPDMMSSMAFSGIIILILQPYAVLNLSALLSYGCVVGIAMLFKPINNFLVRCKLPKWITTSIAMSVSTQATITGVLCYAFKEISFVGIITNLVVLPVFSVLFSCAFVIAMLSLIIPVISWLLIFVNPLFELMNWVIMFIGNNAHYILMPKFRYFSLMMWFLIVALLGRFDVKSWIFKVVSGIVAIFILSFQLFVW